MSLLRPRSDSVEGTGPGSGRARFVAVLLLTGLVAACGPPRQRFQGTHRSPEALTEAVLRALEAEDRAALEALRLSEQEFQLEVFPEMPVYGNVPPDFAWSQLEARNRHGLATVLDRQGGHAWVLEGIDFGGRTSYQTFTVHREPMLRVRDPRTGERKEMALFGSIVEADDRYKLLSFNIDR